MSLFFRKTRTKSPQKPIIEGNRKQKFKVFAFSGSLEIISVFDSDGSRKRRRVVKNNYTDALFQGILSFLR